jgi:hypothetical protein
VRRPVPGSDTVLSELMGTVVAPPVLAAISVHDPAARVDEACTV